MQDERPERRVSTPSVDGSLGTRLLPAVLSVTAGSVSAIDFLGVGLLLAGFLAACVAAGPRIEPNGASAVLAGMLGVSAMAVQNALLQISLTGAPPTNAMTSRVARSTMDLREMLIGREPEGVARARTRTKRTWPTLVGFTVGCALGAAGEAAIGLWSLVLPPASPCSRSPLRSCP